MHRFAAALLLLVVAAPAGALIDPGQPGKLAVGVTTVIAVDLVRERALPTEIWYPAKTAGRDTPPTKKTFPLILLAHGFCGSRLNYEYLAMHLASHGFVVAAPDFPGLNSGACAAGNGGGSIEELPYDLSFVCRELHDVDGRLGQYARRVRGFPTGVVGHSLGGFAAFEAARIDELFTVVVGLAPALQGDDAVPLADVTPARNWMVQGATADETVPFTGWTEPFFLGLPTPAFLVRVTGGSHSGFTDSSSALTPEALAAQQAAVKRTATPFFLKYLSRRHKFGRRLRSFDDGTVALVARTK